MTLRDYFAAKALAGLMATNHYEGDDFLHERGPEAAAMWAYHMADAMLAARQK